MGEVQGIKLQEPVRNWWTDLFAVPGACEQCSRTVLLTLIEFMCLMAVPTVVGAIFVLFAAFAPAAADEVIALMDEKVRQLDPSPSLLLLLLLLLPSPSP